MESRSRNALTGNYTAINGGLYPITNSWSIIYRRKVTESDRNYKIAPNRDSK